ncbi:hypothetical protein [Endozoicomonas ascidiicola]|uniref:hypothetical protein n=1 Tax=Endozoicomonas ascidiicola TaxID=1698521 RepID=UPI00082CF306|nr:hypothetical protein [Endozoicomonas ascidiicola]
MVYPTHTQMKGVDTNDLPKESPDIGFYNQRKISSTDQVEDYHSNTGLSKESKASFPEKRLMNRKKTVSNLTTIEKQNSSDYKNGSLEFYSICILLSFLKYHDLIGEPSKKFCCSFDMHPAHPFKQAVEQMKTIEITDSSLDGVYLTCDIVAYCTQNEDVYRQLSHPSLLLRGAPQILDHMPNQFFELLKQWGEKQPEMELVSRNVHFSQLLKVMHLDFLNLLNLSQIKHTMCATEGIDINIAIQNELTKAPEKLAPIASDLGIDNDFLDTIESACSDFVSNLNDENNKKDALAQYDSFRKTKPIMKIRKLTSKLEAEDRPYAQIRPSQKIYNLPVALKWAELELEVMQTQEEIVNLVDISGKAKMSIEKALKSIEKRINENFHSNSPLETDTDDSFSALIKKLNQFTEQLSDHYKKANTTLREAKKTQRQYKGAGVPQKLINEMKNGSLISIKELNTVQKAATKIISMTRTTLNEGDKQCREILTTKGSAVP